MFHNMGIAETGTQAIDRAAQLLVQRRRERAAARRSASSRRAPGCRRAPPRGSSARSSGRGSSSAPATAARCARAGAAPLRARGTERREPRRARRAERCARSPTRPARRSTSRVPAPLGVEHLAQRGHAPLHRRHELGRPARPVPRRPRTARCFLACGAAARASRRTITDRASWAVAVRARGYATAVDELELGLAALAAPVFGRRRRRRRSALHLRARRSA